MTRRFRFTLLVAWAALVASAGYGFVFHRAALLAEFQRAASVSILLAGAVYLVAGCLRGFTLIPSTSLVLIGLPFLPPRPLFALTLVGIAVSSAGIYRFAASTGVNELIERRHRTEVERLRALLEKYELPVIVGWSFFPLAPTDLICYVCGVLGVGFWTFLLGVCLGEGTICGVYIFLGDTALHWMGRK